MKDTATQAPADAAAVATAHRPETASPETPAVESAFFVDGEQFDADEIRRMLDPAAPFDARAFNRASRAFGFAAVPDGSAYVADAWREIREAHDAPLGCRPVLSAAGAAFAHWMRGAIRVREAYRAAMDATAGDDARAAWRVEALSAECCARSTANARFSLGVPVMPADAPQGAEAPEPEPAPEPDAPDSNTIRCCLCGAVVPRMESDNPWPLDGGDEDARCCHSCNETKVLQARLRMAKPPVHAPGCVTIDNETARTAAGWLRAYLADAVAAEDYPLDAEGIASVTRCLAALEGVTALEA